MQEVYRILIYSAMFTILLGIGIALYKFKILTPNLKRAMLLLVLVFVTECIIMTLQKVVTPASWLYQYTGPAAYVSNWLYQYTGPLQYVATAWFFLNLVSNPLAKKIILFSIPLSILLALLNSVVFKQSYVNFTILKGFFISVCALLYIQNLLHHQRKSRKLNYPEFVICIGLMFYFSFSVVFWSVYRYLVIYKDPHMAIFLKIFPLMAVANIVMYIAFVIGFAIYKTKPKVQFD